MLRLNDGGDDLFSPYSEDKLVLSQVYNTILALCFPEDGTRGGGGVLPYMGYIGMCRSEGYGFQAVYSRIGYINESVWV